MKDKPAYRMPLFRDLYKILLTISSGAIVAGVTFIQNLKFTASSRTYFYWGFGLLVSSIVLQLLMSLVNVIGQGFYWNGEKNLSEPDAILAQKWGKASGILLIVSIGLTIAGIVLIAIFVDRNIGRGAV